jgi:hypothetical protein
MRADIRMDDWLSDSIMEFYSIIEAGHASKTTNVFEQIIRRNPYLLVNLLRIMLIFLDNVE